MPRRTSKKKSLSADGSWVLEHRDEASDEAPESHASSDEEDVWAIDSAPSSTRSKRAPEEPQFVMPSPSTVSRSTKRSPYDYDDEDEQIQDSRKARQYQRSRQEQAQYSPSKSTNTRRRQPKSTPSSNQNLSMGPPGTAPSALIWSHFLLPTILYCTSLLGHTLAFLKPLFAILLALWLVYFGSTALLKSIFQPRALLTPICSAIPFSATIMPSVCAGVPASAFATTLWPWNFLSSSTSADEEPIDFSSLMAEQAALQDPLFSPSTSALALPMEMKRSEASVRDLRAVVEHSTLPSRKLLAFELDSFVDSARQAGADLASFNARVARAADAVILANRWTLSVLDDLAAQEDAAGGGGGGSLLAWLNPFSIDPRARSEAVLRSQYLAHAAELSSQIDALVLEATSLLQLLAGLDNHLDAIGSIAARDGLSAAGSRDELLANVWTWVGGNRRDRKRLEGQLKLLGDVGNFRRAAVEHVGGVIVRLQGVGAGLEGLRSRVGAAATVGDIEDGENENGQLRIGERVGRKTRQRIPLRVHVESVQMGVERLEEARGETRRLEGDVRSGYLGGNRDAVDNGGRKAVDRT